MYLLGVSCGGESGAALFEDAKLICASNEERFSRIKLDTSFPSESINWCLQYAGISSQDIDLVVYGFSTGNETETQKVDFLDTLINLDMNSESSQIIRDRVLIETQVDQEHYDKFMVEVKSFFKRDISVRRVNHHMSHVASAYIPSGMSEALVVSADGRGDYRSLTIGVASEVGFEELYVAPSWSSLGYFYGRMTKLCGFTANRHEGKVTGLAAFGEYEKALSFVEKMIYVKEGKIISNLGDYYRPFFTNYSEKLLEEASHFTAQELASATQYYFEKMFTELIHFYLKKSGLKNIALAGGVFSNISLNQAIYNIEKDLEVFVYPNMGDAGICVGSCYAWLWENKKISSHKIDTMYLGYKVEPLQIFNEAKENGMEALKPDDIYESIINILISGKTVGVSQGQAEFGPRALGNRSILASPQDINIIQRINKQLGRDTFMPLAPLMPLELAEEFIEFKDENSFNKGYFMTMTFDAKEKLKDIAEAVVHVDGTVRPQFVTKQSNKFIYELLMAWYKKTGCPALINTSFNSHEEPIVNSEKDIISSLIKGAVDSIVCPPYIVKNH